MLKEKILTALKKRFEGFGIQDSLLDRFATTLAVTVKEESAIDASVQAIQMSQLVQSEVDSKITSSNKKAVENAQSKIIAEAFKLKGLNEDGTPVKKPKPGEDVPAFLKDFMADQKKKIDELTLQITTNAKKDTAAKLRADLFAQLDEAKVSKEYYEDLSIGEIDPEKVSERAVEITAKYQKLVQNTVNQNLEFDKPHQKQLKVEESDIGDFLDEKFGKVEEK